MTPSQRRISVPESYAIIRALLFGCQQVLDLGCGEQHHTKHLDRTVCVDVDPDHAKGDNVWIMDMRQAPTVFRKLRFDAVLMTDSIEHIPKEDGLRLLSELERICDRIIVFTPLGNLWVRPESKSAHDHLSGWQPGDLPSYHHWLWPSFHRFSDGNTHGAFFAWKWTVGLTPTPEDISKLSGVTP